MITVCLRPPPSMGVTPAASTGRMGGFKVVEAAGGGVAGCGQSFPSFLPKEVERIKDPFARNLAQRIERLPVHMRAELVAKAASGCGNVFHGKTFPKGKPLQLGVPENCIMSSCVKPLTQGDANPLLLLHCFDSSCLEWRCTFPLLEEAGMEAWAVDVLGWGFSDLGRLPSCNAASKRHHLYQFWKSYIKRPVVLVGPSLGASVAIDFAVSYPKAVDKMILINPSVYAKGTGRLTKMPKMAAYAGVSLLKSLPLRLYANFLAFNCVSVPTMIDWTNVGRLHCLLPWWKDATVNFMFSGGYNVVAQIKKVKQKALIISSEHDQIVSYKLASRLHSELPNAILRQVPKCGHLPHVEKPNAVTKLISDFAQNVQC